MKVLLTGANGQVGNEIKLTVPLHIELISLDRQTLDITSAEGVKKVFDQYKPDLVINAAAYTAVDKAEQEKELAYAVNVTGSLNLAVECKNVHIPLIHISTDYVFDGTSVQPYIELDQTAPLGVYGKTKFEGEEAIRANLNEHIILRTSWVFGYFGNNFVKTILRLAKQHQTLRIVADQYGCPTAAENIADVIWQVVKQIKAGSLEKIPWGTYHYTNQPAVSWYEFTKEILSIAKKYSNLAVQEVMPITTAEYPTIAKRPAYSVLNSEKIENSFGVVSQLWQHILQDVIKNDFVNNK